MVGFRVALPNAPEKIALIIKSPARFRMFGVQFVLLAFLPNDVKWDPLRANPRFISLLDRCGFVPS